MFRQIRIHQDDWKLQQIIWKDARAHYQTFQLTTVTYGTRSAPFLAGRVFNQLVDDEGNNFPLAIAPLTIGRYVDDICGGADSQKELKSVAEQGQGLCSAGQFPLAKWHSNSSELLASLAPEHVSHEQHRYEDSSTKILGLSWLPSTDHFIFSSRTPSTTTITKHTMLSEVAQLFDPLGFLSPVVIRAKMLMQKLWTEKVGWDDTLASSTQEEWSKFREELTHLEEIRIPRWIGTSTLSSIEVHGFADASNLAMAAVVYLKITTNGGVRVSQVCAKSKVAPTKQLVIPRLELNAAVILARLTQYTLNQLNLTEAPVFLWTDLPAAYHWVSSHSSRWKEYVRNRVFQVQEAVPQAQWRHVPGKENPADCASRGVSAMHLRDHHLWWTGPAWLQHDSSAWPSSNPAPDASINLEEKPRVLLSAQTHQPEVWNLIFRYSSLAKLVRITASCQKFIARLKEARKQVHKHTRSSASTSLTSENLETSRLLWVKLTQQAHFSRELKLIVKNKILPRAHPLSRLNAQVDNQGVLRLTGRLKFAQLDPESIHPAIIPRDSHLARLIISEAHERTLHGGTQVTATHIRRSYWIIGGRAPVRSYILRCVICARQRGVRAQPLMGQLPAARITPTRAFLNTGVDYAGPVSLRTWKGRGHKTAKGWLAIFLCMATSAVHLEVVSDYSTEGFIAAYRRFISRRGICRNLFSDCGTNFIGVDKELKKLFASGSKDSRHLAHLLLNDGTQWSFNPPGAPHFGGKWEAAVKSVKHHLIRTTKDSTLTYEELSTLLTQIEAVLNSRPLVPLTDDPDDIAALTSGHFLIGEAPITVPEPALDHFNINILSRWQLIQHKFQSFCRHWSTSYLQSKQAITKWHHLNHDIKIGALALLTDERFPPSKWPLARITALHPGPDGLTRVVTVKTAATSLDRPITKLALLPIATNDSEPF